MFISTYGYEQMTEEGRRWHGLLHKAIDFDNGIEVFEIGTHSGVDREFDGAIYCLKKGNYRIPFIVKNVSVISDIPMSSFNKKTLRYINPAVTFPEVSIRLSSLGKELTKIPLLRARLYYKDVWNEGEAHGYEFSSSSELSNAFKSIQEALPVLLFEDYRSTVYPRPSLCRHVLPFTTDKVDGLDCSGDIEGRSVHLSAPEQPELPQSIFARIEEYAKKSPIRIERLMAELLSAERGNLFYGHLFTSNLLSNEKIIPILRESFEEYYKSHHSCFERFVVRIFGIIESRQASRAVYERYSWRVAPSPAA